MLTFNNGVLFRTKLFTPDYRYTANFVDAWSVDEVVMLDVTRPGCGSKENFHRMISEFAQRCFVPLSVGGGVRSVTDFELFLSLGADKVVVNTGAAARPELITEASRLYGSQCVVVSVDARKTGDDYEVFTDFGRKALGKSPADWAKEAEECGAGEILITSIDKDGSLEGYDNRLNRMVSEVVSIPVLVCGGAGKWQDFVDGFKIGEASGVCTTCIYHFTEASIKSAKKYLLRAGIDVRP